MAMHGWSERWLCPDGPPLHLIDTQTGKITKQVMASADNDDDGDND